MSSSRSAQANGFGREARKFASAEALAKGRARNYGMPVEAQHLLVVDDDAGIRDVVRAYAARDG